MLCAILTILRDLGAVWFSCGGAVLEPVYRRGSLIPDLTSLGLLTKDELTSAYAKTVPILADRAGAANRSLGAFAKITSK
jgi:hypothetical protein